MPTVSNGFLIVSFLSDNVVIVEMSQFAWGGFTTCWSNSPISKGLPSARSGTEVRVRVAASFELSEVHAFQISNGSLRDTKPKLTGEPFNSIFVPVLTCILSYFHAKLGVVPMILASLPLLIQYTDNFVVSCSGRGISLNPG